MEFNTEKTRVRVENRGITLEEIQYCLDNYTDSYRHRQNTVYTVQLERGTLKVEMEGQRVANAFIVR